MKWRQALPVGVVRFPLPSRAPSRSIRVVVALLAACSMSLLLACEEGKSVDDVREMQQEGRFEDSLEPLRALLDASPEDPELNYRYGVALRWTGSPDQAIWALRKAATSEEWKRAASFELGSAAIASGEWANAIEIANRLLETDPDDLDALRVRAEALLAGKLGYEEALADYDTILEFEPDDLDVRASRAATLIALGRIEEAGAEIEEMSRQAEMAEASEPVRARLCLTRALFADEQGEKEEAETAFKGCLEKFPKNRQVLQSYVEFLDASRRFSEANELLEARLEERPIDTVLRVELSQRLISLGQEAEAEAILRVGLEHPNPDIAADVWSGLTDYYISTGDLVRASDAYQESFDLRREPSEMHRFILADLLAQAERNDRALEVARPLENDDYRGLVEARVFMNQHEPAKALARLDGILPNWPNNPGARYWAARAAEQTGAFDRAIEEYRQAIRSGPGFTNAGLRLARIHLASGASEDAWVAVFRYAEETPGDSSAAELLSLLATRFGPEARMRSVASRYRGTKSWPVVVAARARVIAERQGFERGIESIRASRGIDLTRSEHASLLAEFVDQLLALARTEEARAAIDAALERAPDSAAIVAIDGRWYAEQGDAEAARARFERALELDAAEASAQLGLGRVLAKSGNEESAIERFDVARRLDVDLVAAYVEAAQLLAKSGRPKEAELRWMELLREHPHDVGAAIALVRSRLERGQSDDRTLELAQRAVRFEGGEIARRLLAKVHAERGDKKRANEILERLARQQADQAEASVQTPEKAQ